MRFPYYLDDYNNLLLQKNLEILATRGKPQEDFITAEISEFRNSETYKWMELSEKYYQNENDIRGKKRKAVDGNGNITEDKLLPNNIISHAFLRNNIDEKTAFILSKPFSIKCDNKDFENLLNKEVFTPKFRMKLKNVVKDSYKKGISYLQPIIKDDGTLDFKYRPGDKIIPFWADEEHTELDAFILIINIRIYELDHNYRDVEYVEFVDNSGVYRYIFNGKDGSLSPYTYNNAEAISGHFKATLKKGENEETKELNWDKLPLIAFKCNADEYSVLRSIKSLIDDYDKTTSDLSDSIGDLPYSIKIIVNYDGTDLAELANNLYTYRMVKVSDGGDLKTLTQTIDITSINAHLDRLKDDIYEFGRIVNDKTAVATNASGKALDRLYNKIDLDGTDTINELQEALQNVLWFVKWYYKTQGKNFDDVEVTFDFNKDLPTDESTIIANCVSSKGIISDETIISNHPWVTDVQQELEKIKKQEKENMEMMMGLGGYGTLPEDGAAEEGLADEEETIKEEE